MANINDYLLWRGDLPINDQFEFNEIDSMILARFSYLRFDKININENETIESISNKMKNLNNEEFRYNGDKELITNLGQSIRFKDMLVTDFVQIDDKKDEKQFGAITIHISNKELYVSFIGTDDTLIGWKEDFNMAFMDNVPCQSEGKDYLVRIAEKYKKSKIRIGGHSKGGNVAIYSAISSSEAIQKRIIKVYNYDGPGFTKEIVDKYKNSKVIDKIETYIPQESIIGRILNHKEKITISSSTEKGLYQHDLYSWQVLKTDLIKLEKNTQISENLKNTLDNWLSVTTNEQRKIFFDTIFELFYSTEADTFANISKTLTQSIPKILKKYTEITKEDKKTITEMIMTFAKAYFSIIRKNVHILHND